ncbi:HlyD family type I secretion periplasmic adaptor subunit [Pseudoduganella armeniaca]|uniref:Membrane fusion protein (MFP) family protein n=1 Tax=Pseudoduganella armeniaca TaxID=2072590 RepID=A0A2R4C440_9BURK|nr:HlyD family type I secretion periplasmic adaptor subunit [Pseudoduganella armeniaca]AVR94308.1 HlyD family type I secretion periplasmic adaptor subunit [Pseudoduganella armeniaca]
MEPANKSSVKGGATARKPDVEFLPDADEIELRPLPLYARITVPVLATGLLVAALWASFSEVDQVVVADGRLVNPLPNMVLQPLETSIVQRINVRQGQVVRKGDVLATLDPTFAQADEDQLRARLKSLDTQIASLTAELGGAAGRGAGADADSQLQQRLASERRANFEAQKRRIEENVARLRASLETNQRDQEVLASRLKSVAEMEAMQEKLVAQQYGARMKLLEARDRRLEVERDQLLAKNREQEIKRELAGQESELSAFSKGWRQKTLEDLLAVTRERDTLNEQVAKADRRRQMVSMVAPADAVVLEVAKLSPGSIAREAEPFFTLVPLAAELEAEVQIESLDVGYIRVGHPVHLKLDAFPYQRHGDLPGTVRTISEDAFRRDSQQGGAQGAYYLSRIALQKGATLTNMTPQARLLPGMTLKAEIVVGKRTVMSYLLWPLKKSVNESIREP